MGLLFGENGRGESTERVWEVKCLSDPRFNMIGKAYSTIAAAVAAENAILKKAAELGVSIPTDVEHGEGGGL